MALLDTFTGGKSDDALEALRSIPLPTLQQLSLPELQQYADSLHMTPAQMQSFLQERNALEDQNIDQSGTEAQKAALARLAETASQGEHGDATMRAQQAQIAQDQARELAGQRGAIDQQAQARGVPLGLLQAALSQQNAGQGAQNAHMAALNAQSNNYQTALQALANQGQLGNALQGQQNTQANNVANAANAMQQFNAANQQNAASANAGYQQAANAMNTTNQNAINQANTGLKNQQLIQNSGVAQQNFNNQMQKQTGISNLQNQQGQQNAGITSGLIGAGATLLGGMYGGPAGAAAGGALAKGMTGGNAPPAYANTQQYAPQGPNQSLNYAHGGEVCMTDGGKVPGEAKHPGDSYQNDTVTAKLSPGEFVVPRTIVQSHPEDIAALLQAMRHLRGSK